MRHVDIFSDGSSRGNPGPGGYGTILRYVDPKGNTHESEFSQGYLLTTNNRMELLGVITGLSKLKEACEVDIYTDSQYVVKAFSDGWVDSWISKGWKNSKKQPVKNKDLWLKLIELKAPHKVNFIWVKGHAGHPENERCDELATQAALGSNLIEDSNLESIQQSLID